MSRPTYRSLFLKFQDTYVVNRCEQYAKWTLPYLMADVSKVSMSGRVIVERDFQEIGALLTGNLASKLAQLLFPTQFPFFTAEASDEIKALARTRGIGDEELRSMFARMEVGANKRLFLNSGYAGLILMLKHLIVTGQCLVYRDSKDATITAYGLNQFATRRDGKGDLLDCVLRENTTVEALSPDLQAALRTANSAKYGRPECPVEKYTRIHRVMRNGRVGYEVSQQVDTVDVGKSGWYPKHLCPWMCPTWVLIPGEHYARGMVEEYAGGFARLSALSEGSALYTVEMLRVLHLVGASAGSTVDELALSESGEWIRADPNGVAVHEAGDAGKLEQTERVIERTVMRLARAFMYEGITRQAERVTAYELERQATEANNALGGVYSTLSGGIQVPLAHLLLTEVSEDALAGIVTGELTANITAGIPALGRSGEVQNLLLAAQEIAAVMPVAQLDKRINPARIIDLILAGRSIDPRTVFFTPAEQKANSQAEAAVNQGAESLIQADTLASQQGQLNQLLGG